MGVIYKECQEFDATTSTGDFANMIDKFPDSLFIFNDNTKDADGCEDKTGKWKGTKGAGNGVFRPFAFEPSPRVLGIPTGNGSGFQTLTEEVADGLTARGVIKLAVDRIVAYLYLRPELTRVFFSRDPKEDRLGKGSYNVSTEVLNHITGELRSIPTRIAELEARWVLRIELMDKLEDGKHRSGRLGDWGRERLALVATDASMPDASDGVRGWFKEHGVSPNGNCWGFAPLASIGLLEHKWTSGASNPTATDTSRINSLLRPRMHDYLLSKDGADLRKHYDLNTTDGKPDRKKIDPILVDGEWQGPWYPPTLAAILQVDIASFHPVKEGTQLIDGYFADKRQLELTPREVRITPKGKRRQSYDRPTITEAEMLRRLTAPEMTPLIPMTWNGSNHFSGMVLLDGSPFPHLPPRWLKVGAPICTVMSSCVCEPVFVTCWSHKRFLCPPSPSHCRLSLLLQDGPLGSGKPAVLLAAGTSTVTSAEKDASTSPLLYWVKQRLMAVTPGPAGRASFKADDAHRTSVAQLWCNEVKLGRHWQQFDDDDKKDGVEASKMADTLERCLELVDICQAAGAQLFGISTQNCNCGIFSMALVMSILHKESRKDDANVRRFLQAGSADDMRAHFEAQKRDQVINCSEMHQFTFDELQVLFKELFPALMGDARIAQISLFSTAEYTALLENVHTEKQSVEDYLEGDLRPGWNVHIGDTSKPLAPIQLKQKDGPEFFLVVFGDELGGHFVVVVNPNRRVKPLSQCDLQAATGMPALVDSAALKQALPNRVALFSKLPSRTPASVGTLRIPTLLSHTCMPSLRCSLFLCAQVNSPPAQKANAASQPLPADAVAKPLLSRQSRYGTELVGRYILLKGGVWFVLRFDSAVTKEHVCTNAEGREERFFLGSKNAVLDIVPTEKEKPCEYRDLPWIKSDGSGKETERISFAKCEPSGPGDETYGRVLVALMPTCKMGEPDREDTDSKLLFTEMRNWTKSLNAARVALLAAEENAEISSVEELESHVTHRLARLMRVDPLDAASTPVHTLLIIGAHGSEHKPGSICFRPGGAPQDVRALASRIRSLLPGPLRPYLTHIHFDACTSLDGVAPLPGMVLTGYDIAVGYESSRELTKHIVAAFKRAAENTEAGLDSVHGKAVADELTKMRNDFGPPEGEKGLGGNASGESAKANVDGFTIADLAQHLLILWEAPVKVRDAEICEAWWHTHAACESFAHLRGRTVYKFTRLSHAIAASPNPSWAHATSTSQRMMTDVIRATPRRQERKTTIASHSRCSLPIFRI